MSTSRRTEEAETNYHLATAKTAALGTLLAQFLHDGHPAASLNIIIADTLTAATEIDNARDVIREQAGQARTEYARYRTSRGIT